MNVEFAPEELDAVIFAVQADLEIVTRTLVSEPDNEDLLAEASLLASALDKLEGVQSGDEV